MCDNIRVAVRMRPLIPREMHDKEEIRWNVQPPTTIYQAASPPVAYNFDRVFNSQEENEVVYNEFCFPVVKSVVDGFNGTIFAYGQTSSGKTFTMMGDKEMDVDGIIQFTVYDLFRLIQNMPEREFLLRVSYMEIYNEMVRDLLPGENEKNGQRNENLKQLEEVYGHIKVSLTEHIVPQPEDVIELMKKGERRRTTGETRMNDKSSRSHAIFRMVIESRLRQEKDEVVNVSQFNLVDLAGSERAKQTGAKGLRFKESININKSLLVLSQVISQLSEKEPRHINYRDSILTNILKNSLGGNSLTSIICTVTPVCIEETLSTLKFATRAKSIKNKPERIEVKTEKALLKCYANKLKKLAAELEATKEEKDQQNKNLHEQIETLKKLFVSQMTPVPKTRSTRRETWGGCLDAARIKRSFATDKPYLLTDSIALEDDRPRSRPFSLQNKFLPSLEESITSRKSCSSRSQLGSYELPTLEEECEDVDLIGATETFFLPQQNTRSKSLSKHSYAHSVADAVVQTEIEALCSSPKLSQAQKETLRTMSQRISSLEKELAELQEFTTLEKQILAEDNCEVCKSKDLNVSMKDERSFITGSQLIVSDVEDTNENEAESAAENHLHIISENNSYGDTMNGEEVITENFVQKEPANSVINTSRGDMNEEKEEVFHYLESTIKILSMRKRIDFSSIPSNGLKINYKIMLEMFNLILQYHCLSFEGCFKSEMSKKISSVLEQLSKVFQTFSNQSTPNEAAEDLAEIFIDKTESMLKEIEMCSLDADDDKNAIVNQSRPFDSFCDLPSFEKSFASAKSLRLSVDQNEIDKKDQVNSTINATKTEENAPVFDSNVDTLKSKIFTLEQEIGTYQKAISSYKYDIDLREKRIAILQDKTDIQKQIIDRFEDDSASNSKMAISPSSTANNNVTTTFRDQACQYNHMEGISLISSGLNETGEQDLSSLSRNLCSNCEKSFIDTGVSVNRDFQEIPFQVPPILSLTDSEKENIIEEHRIYLEATLSDLTELKLFALDFMKRDMKKEYLWDVDSFEQQGKFPLQDQIKIEVTALKEMLGRLEFYSRDQAESTEHFKKFFEEQLNQSESILKEKEAEMKELKEGLFNMEKDLDELVHKIKCLAPVEDYACTFEWEADLSKVIIHTSKTLNCITRMHQKISKLNKSICKKSSLIDDMSLTLKEVQEKLMHFQEKDQNIFKLTKSVQTAETLEYLELSQKLKETESYIEVSENERKELKAKLEILIKEKEDLQKELEDKTKLYCDKLKDIESKFEAEKQEWTANTEECVKRIEEKCDEMMTEQENKFFDEIRQIKHEHNLQLLKNDNNIQEQWQRRIDHLKEEHERNVSEIKSRLLETVQEKHKIQSELAQEINILKKNIDHYRESNSSLKSKGKQLMIELQRRKEKLKALEQREKDNLQEKSNAIPEKLLENKETQTSIPSARKGDEHSDVCSQCRMLQKQISDSEVLKQKVLTDDAKGLDTLCKRLQNELEEKKAKILSLNTNNEKMVNEIKTLKRESSTKSRLLRNCHCRGLFTAAETENGEKLETMEKRNDVKYKNCDKEDKSSELRNDMNSEDILQMDIVQKAILKAREEEMAILNDGNGPAGMMKCYLLQGKLNKKDKEIDSLKKQLKEFKNQPVKKTMEAPSNQAFAGPADFEENVTVYTTTVNPFPDAYDLKRQPKKILKERNRKSMAPYQLNAEMKKPYSDFVAENIYPAATLPVSQTKTPNKDTVKIDKAEATRREIRMLASGEPQCRQQ